MHIAAFNCLSVSKNKLAVNRSILNEWGLNKYLRYRKNPTKLPIFNDDEQELNKHVKNEKLEHLFQGEMT